MGVAILFRQTLAANLFRQLVLRSISARLGTEVLICSGFFQELFGSNTYQVSTDGNLVGRLVRSGAQVTTIGIHNRTWLPAYRAFSRNLRTAGVQIRPRLSRRFHWHAKVFMISSTRGPLLGIIGSSNMTRNAFGLSAPFNYEADVVLWRDDRKGVARVVERVFSEGKPLDVLRTAYSVEANQGVTLTDRLVDIRIKLIESASATLDLDTE